MTNDAQNASAVRHELGMVIRQFGQSVRTYAAMPMGQAFGD